MTASVPWSVNAVEPETWAAARDAARRSGLSVGEWLDAAIRESAAERSLAQHGPERAAGNPIEHRLDDIADRLDHFTRRLPDSPPIARERGGNAQLLASIEAINDRIDGLIRDTRPGDRNAPADVRTAIQRLEDRLDDLMSRSRIAGSGAPSELDQKLSSIAAAIENMNRRLEQENQRYPAAAIPSNVPELDAAIADVMRRQSVLDGVPMPREVPHLSHAPALAPAAAPTVDLSGLESRLAVMTDEMQALRKGGVQSEAIESLRREVRELSGKLADLAPRHSLEALEKAVSDLVDRLDHASAVRSDDGLSEVANTLNEIRTTLGNIRPAESFSSVEADLRDLSKKLERINALNVDGITVERLHEQTAEIRELLSSALPGDVLKVLVEQIELLVQKFDTSPSSDTAVLDVMNAFDRRIEALSERIEAASRQTPSGPALDDIRTRLDELQRAVGQTGHGESSELAATLQELSQKFDAAEARFANLSTIEGGIKDLLTQLQEARSSLGNAAERAPKAAEREMEFPASAPAARDRPRRPLADLETRYSSANEVSAPPAEPALQPMPVRPNPHAMPAVAHGAAAAQLLDDVTEDFPLEPGSGAPRMRLQSAALRVAQSEAALGPIASGETDSPPSATDFIAAARRAAQVAANEPGTQPATPQEGKAGKKSVRLSIRGRTVFLIALTAFLVIFTAVRFFQSNLSHLFEHAPSLPMLEAPQPKAPADEAPAPAAPSQINRSSLGDRDLGIISAPSAGVLGIDGDTHLLNKLGADFEPTGSIGRRVPPERPGNSAALPDTPANSVEELPAGLAGPALRAAALAGDPAAVYEIGARYQEGRGVGANPAEAIRWFERALAKGSAPAAYRLGSLYEKGQGVPKNPSEARRYYTIAAEAGNIKAMHNLAVLYTEGPAGKPDYASAVRWFRMAAERGVRDSQYNLGVIYARGLGVEQNLAESFRWFAIAANEGDKEAEKRRDDVAKRLDRQTLVATRLAVQTWTEQPADAGANEVSLKPEWETSETAPQRRPSGKK